MKLLRYSWVLPFLVVLYIYSSEALGFFMGSPEHYEILRGLGFPALATTTLVWLSVVIEVTIITAIFLKPSALTFSIAALWPWVPRVISALTGSDMGMMEMNMSLIASIASVCAYMAYEEFRRAPMQKAAYAEG